MADPAQGTDLESLLGQLDLDALRVVAANHGIVFREARPSRGAVAEYLSGRLKDPAKLRAVLERLTPEERFALRLLVLRGEPLREELLHEEINRFLGRRGAGKVVATLLLSRGLVFACHWRWSQVYAVPADLADVLASLFLEEVLAKLPGAQVPAAPRDDDLAFVRDVFTFLAGLQREPVGLTQKGTLYKRAVARLEAQFEVGTGGAGAGGAPATVLIEFGASPFGPRTTLLIDYCSSRQLFLEAQDADRVVPSPRVASWLRLSQEERVRDLHAYCRQRLWTRAPVLARAAEALLSLPAGRWVSVTSLADGLAESDRETAYVLQTLLVPAVMWPLVYVGLSQVGTVGDGLVVAPTALGHALHAGQPLPLEPPTESFYVQPNYEVVAPRTLDLAVRRELEQVAALKATGQAVTYTLTRETLYRALAEGREVEQVLAFLARHAIGGLPQNVAYSLRDWAEHFGRISFVDALVIRCDSAALAQELRSQPRLQPFIVGELGAEHLLVRRADFARLVKTLQQLGYMPRPGVEYPSGPPEPTVRASVAGERSPGEVPFGPPTPADLTAAPPWQAPAPDAETDMPMSPTGYGLQTAFRVTPRPVIRLDEGK